jgi:hypothetical protein
MIELGVFLPVLSNGWIASTTAPRYRPTYAMNKAMTMLAEDLGVSFVLSPVKYRGMGGPTEFWDYALESFEVMAALAEVTDRIRLYGSVALPTVHPAITARRAVTIDHIAQGRFGINLVSGWQKAEYAQMGLWPGDVHYERRYQYAREYVDILKLLWTRRDVDYDGEFFHLRDCRIRSDPSRSCAPGNQTQGCNSPPSTSTTLSSLATSAAMRCSMPTGSCGSMPRRPAAMSAPTCSTRSSPLQPRPRRGQPFPLIALQPPAVRLTQGLVNDFIIDFDQRWVGARAKRT